MPAFTYKLDSRAGRSLPAGVTRPAPEVKNFAQMQVGDQVNIEYVEALTLELKKGSSAPVAGTDQAGPGRRQSLASARRGGLGGR
jgi:hypothetical protein